MDSANTGETLERRGKSHTVFIVDDDPMFSMLLEKMLVRDFDVRRFSNPKLSVEAITKERPDVVLSDFTMPEMNGLELVRAVKEKHPNLPVIVLTAYGNVESSVEVMKAGAFHYLEKTMHGGAAAANYTILRALITRAIESSEIKEEAQRIKKENEQLKQKVRKLRSPELYGSSQAMQAVRAMVEQVAAIDSTVLIRGETGSGKNVAAELIHNRSRRRETGQFVEINCAALPESLLEAELFGYEQGAFTDAKNMKKGLFETANGGTIMLDEIDSASLLVQSKLLTVLETRSFRRVGGTQPVSVDVRVICATNATLEQKVKEKKFREDLFFRINVVTIPMPPLRALGGDIILIATNFIEQFSTEMNKQILGIEEEAKKILLGYRWQGNVRELRNVMERAVIFTPNGQPVSAGQIVLPTFFGGESVNALMPSSMDTLTAEGSNFFTVQLGKTLEDVKVEYIKAVIKACDYKYTDAAKTLDITAKSLWEIRKRHNLSEKNESADV
jgi:two-component system, NtrC family, response regulator AtoC